MLRCQGSVTDHPDDPPERLHRTVTNGWGVPQDYRAALKWFSLAAEQGVPIAQYMLGFMYDTGRGVPQDDKAAVKWYTLAAEQGFAKAQSNLGLMYGKGQGVTLDILRAHMWSNIAVGNGDKAASKNRDIAAKRMSPTDILVAQRLARECMAKDYKGC